MLTWTDFTAERYKGTEDARADARRAHATPEIQRLVALHSDLLDNLHVLVRFTGEARPLSSPVFEASFQVASVLQGAQSVADQALDGMFLKAAAGVRQDYETYLRLAETVSTGQPQTARFNHSATMVSLDANDPDETHQYLYKVLSGLAHRSDWDALRHSAYRVVDERGEYACPWPKADPVACASIFRQHVFVLFSLAQQFGRILAASPHVADEVLKASERQFLAVGDELERLGLVTS